jgi:hypothetical protein
VGADAAASAEWHASSRAFPTSLGGHPDLAAVADARRAYYNQAAFVDDQVSRGRSRYLISKGRVPWVTL